MERSTIRVTVPGFAAAPVWADAHPPTRQPLAMQPEAEMVSSEPIRPLETRDRDRLTAQDPVEGLSSLPGGTWAEGCQVFGDPLAGDSRPRASGGIEGATVIAQMVKTVGETVGAPWRVEADWLAGPCGGADARITPDGPMEMQVATFDPADMVLR